MREIKFRVWSRLTNNWVYPVLDVTNNFYYKDNENRVFEQFTGLQDKNGVDIYEGDKIEVCNNKNGFLTVVFVNEYVGGWVLIHESTEHKLSLGARKQSEIEVIGNIHQS
jgi:uncharacterized phage protein (TIGR01671 family)